MSGNSLVKRETTNITATGSLTFKNKEIDATLNTLRNVNISHLQENVLDTNLNSVSSSHNTIPSANATKTYIDSQIPKGNSVIDWTAQYTSGSKIHSSNLPGLALTDINSVNSESAHLSLSLEEGDIVIRTDLSQTFVHNGGSSNSMADFTLLQTPTSLTSVTELTDVDNAGSGSIITTSERNKLNGIEANSDKTDSANVAAAGAVMTTTNQGIGGFKTFSNIIGGNISGNAATATTSSKILTTTDNSTTQSHRLIFTTDGIGNLPVKSDEG